jgi:hypothetical protein
MSMMGRSTPTVPSTISAVPVRARIRSTRWAVFLELGYVASTEQAVELRLAGDRLT